MASLGSFGGGAVTFSIDDGGLSEILGKLAAQGNSALVTAGKAAMRTTTEKLRTKSQAQVPVVSGVLKGSATVQGPKVKGSLIETELGYGGAAKVYAMITHENPRAGRTGGVSPRGQRYRSWSKVGSYKFLQAPAMAHAPQMQSDITRVMAAFLKKL